MKKNDAKAETSKQSALSGERPSAALPTPALSRLLSRIVTRLTVLAMIALASHLPFWTVWPNLVAIASCACVIVAFAAREAAFRAELNHWDEALVYALVSRGAAMLAGSGA